MRNAPPQVEVTVILAEDDHVIQAFPPNAPDAGLRVGILLGPLRGREHLRCAQARGALLNRLAMHRSSEKIPSANVFHAASLLAENNSTRYARRVSVSLWHLTVAAIISPGSCNLRSRVLKRSNGPVRPPSQSAVEASDAF